LYGGRNGGVSFSTPDVRNYLRELPLSSGSALSDLYALSLDDILDFLDRVGQRLVMGENRHLEAAYALSVKTSGLGPDLLRASYNGLSALFSRNTLRVMADVQVGIPFLENWVETNRMEGYSAHIRAFGARAVHVVAGNSPTVTAVSIARNALLRSDAVIKTPSNDPLTAVAIARTMIDIDPDHPLCRHLSVAYWKGGDSQIEDYLYQPQHIEKLVAWGGLASISHIAKYIQPGIDLITLDPKLSSSIIGAQAFASEEAMEEAARRLAMDIGGGNQEGCVNARVVYIQTGSDTAGVAMAGRFGQMVYDAIQALPRHISTPAHRLNLDLAEEMEALGFAGDAFKVIGGGAKGAIIVSQDGEPVEFASLLANRVANLVPVDDLETPILAVNAYTQTIGIYPDDLATQLRDRLALHGGQRLISLGYATGRPSIGPQDGIEPLRRMCKWVIQETYDIDRHPLVRPPHHAAAGRLPEAV
ncbi:MAG: long-chain-fatty-acyl-CoA reductase, partial [Rhizorhabdus sp.]|nr:long-chain-fatty-acyl-CoA reductase [Rhizorhabdus sp.]